MNLKISEIAEEEDEKEVLEKNENQILEENPSNLSPSNSSEISPIPNEICFKKSDNNENVSPQVVSLETKKETRISTKGKVGNNNNNHDNDTAVSVRPKCVKRKKRKRICMPANWRGKLSPQEKVTKSNIMNGKELDIQRKPFKGFKVKIKEDGNVTFDQCPYKLRSRSIQKSVQTAVVNDFKEIENLNNKKENSSKVCVFLENSLNEEKEECQEEEETVCLILFSIEKKFLLKLT